MKLTRRECLAALTTLGVASGCKIAPPQQASVSAASTTDASTPIPVVSKPIIYSLVFKPEDFGAVGDGVTNDTDAFNKMTAVINRMGGGTVLLRNTTYIVGEQGKDPNSPWAYAPRPIMTFDGCSKDLTILGQGARFKCADGLRYGTFDPVTGLPTQHSLPFLGQEEIAIPYIGMLVVQNCTGNVLIKNLEFDGNIDGLWLGGPYGDSGWQLATSGLRLLNNTGGEHVMDVHSHHHGQDGVYLDGPPVRTASTLLENVVSEYNGRQGCSIVGGCNYSFANCRFNHTGKGRIMSAPAAGVDIEAENISIRNINFSSCEFSNNTGVGLIADSGDSDGGTFDKCTFVGTTAWSAWPRMPHFRFTDCTFVGAICGTHPDADPERAAKFIRCTFVDDPALSPTGEVFMPSEPIANLGAGDLNVLFDTCRFDLKHALVLPWSQEAIYKDCTMSQVSTELAATRGTFTGVNVINGNVDIYMSKIVGTLTINGVVRPPRG